MTGRAAAPERLDACLAFTLREEGGFSDDPHDPGGATQAGITLATFRTWRADPAASVAALHAVGPTEVRALYGALYWSAVGAPGLSSGLDLMAFDMAVNAGVGASARMLQRTAGAAADGHVGPATLAAVRAAPAPALLDGLAEAQAAYYRALPGFSRYGRGWLGRLDRRAALARRMAGVLPAGQGPGSGAGDAG